MRLPKKHTIRLEVRLEPDLREAVTVAAVLEGQTDAEYARSVLARATSARYRRASDNQLRAAIRKVREVAS